MPRLLFPCNLFARRRLYPPNINLGKQRQHGATSVGWEGWGEGQWWTKPLAKQVLVTVVLVEAPLLLGVALSAATVEAEVARKVVTTPT